jgi:hypothetical protein
MPHNDVCMINIMIVNSNVQIKKVNRTLIDIKNFSPSMCSCVDLLRHPYQSALVNEGCAVSKNMSLSLFVSSKCFLLNNCHEIHTMKDYFVIVSAIFFNISRINGFTTVSDQRENSVE